MKYKKLTSQQFSRECLTGRSLKIDFFPVHLFRLKRSKTQKRDKRKLLKRG